MPTVRLPRNLASGSPTLRARSADLNAVDFVNTIMGHRTRPMIRYVNSRDIAEPPAPAWYIPKTHDVYIHCDEAKIGDPATISVVDIRDAWRGAKMSSRKARTLGLLAHETGHAAISHRMDGLEASHRHHIALLTLLEELRVENYALRQAPQTRPFLRASFGLVLANLSDEFTDQSHVVRAWTIARGRTLAGVAAPEETEAVDTAARTLLGDDVIDTLTDILQEALTLKLGDKVSDGRMVELCDEWKALVGDTEPHGSCTHGVAIMGEAGDPGEPGEGDDAGEGSPGAGEGDDDADGTPGDTDGNGESDWGKPGAADPDEDSDDAHVDDTPLSDEDGELMKMLKRDLEKVMGDEWARGDDAVQLSKPGEWAAKVFGNRRASKRIDTREAPSRIRQHVVTVAQELSNLSLPAIAKSARQQQAPPGRMRSREALRASAERAQGKMMTAKPWSATVRKHSAAKPLVIGIATDTSGSMRWAEAGVAEFAYVYANAGHRIGARTAAVTFGDHVHRIARPGEVMDKILTKTASDGTEEFDQAMASLDGVLHLTAPGGAARILFVISDGQFVKQDEGTRAYQWCKAMDKAGTHVVWITDTDASGYDSYTGWLRDARKLPRFTVRSLAGEGSAAGSWRSSKSVFEMLNESALEAIRKDIHA